MSRYVVYNLANSVCEVTTCSFPTFKIGTNIKTGFKINLNHCLILSLSLSNYIILEKSDVILKDVILGMK